MQAPSRNSRMFHIECLEILGLNPKTALSSLTAGAVKSAFKKKALERHPDKNTGMDKGFGALNAAYQHLVRMVSWQASSSDAAAKALAEADAAARGRAATERVVCAAIKTERARASRAASKAASARFNANRARLAAERAALEATRAAAEMHTVHASVAAAVPVEGFGSGFAAGVPAEGCPHLRNLRFSFAELIR